MSRISDEIYKNIESQIVNGVLKPGDKLPSEKEYCEIWNTSRISVRQAIERLVSLGILKKFQGSGTYVCEPDSSIFMSPLLPYVIFREESIIDILEFRKIIEVGSAQKCALNCDAETFTRLENCLAEMGDHFDDSQLFAEADMEFHMEIARGSKNSLNVKINEMLRFIMRKHQINLNKMIGPSGGLKDHRDILVAIKERNPELAAHFMEKHIVRTIEDIKKLYGEAHAQEGADFSEYTSVVKEEN